jgi:predicted GIY-YIG superfamily endonuclease
VSADEEEKHLKGWKRARKLTLTAEANLAWLDLRQDWYGVEPAEEWRTQPVR